MHYFPVSKEINKKEDGLCSWHLDHGCLTMLTSAIFLDENKVETIKPNDCGLLIKDQCGNTVYGNIPSNALLCQAGETLQILSGGHIVANQHAVKSHINNIVIGSGSVEATDIQGRVIKANKITYKKSEEFLIAEGSVQIYDIDGNILKTNNIID